jgi:glycosyltransferase involved in cell wall biosynthesis
MLTVLMATHNGADTIGRTLSAFCHVVPPAGGWTLLVVNNGSTDQTEQIVHSFRDQLPIQVVEAPTLGKSRAVNAGLGHCTGDLVVLVDDDVIPDRDFLVEWRRAADNAREFAVFGGTISPQFEVPPPDWIPDPAWMVDLYAATKPGRPSGELHFGDLDIYGPNMALRTSTVLEGHRFDERLMVGSLGLMGEDSEFVERLVSGGARAYFVAPARVQHLIHRDQVTWRWIMRRFYRLARGDLARGALRYGANVPTVLRIPRFLIRRIAGDAVSLPIALASRDRRRLAARCRTLAYNLGLAAQARAIRATPGMSTIA